MSTTQSERLRELLEPLAASKELDLEEITVTPAGKRRVLRVVVDSDNGVELDTCAELSREVSEKLDATDVMGDGEYVLEVTSPGADRPLTEHRHYVRANGRLVKFQLNDDGELTARILGIDDEGLDLEVPGVKGRKPTARRLDFGDIAKARVEIEFSRKDKKPSRDAEAGEDVDAENAEEA
ncbi:ribosome maturation factor RimP [Streptomyces tsukubensis]|uniref:Ribosome maturation factor RimP n=1 Tax=Streptomyces tsukubensis TaxID=83656 RepID=A0A1V4A666_9ACTN|nr:ribosome maturation factor RimP [Streptomyces tsukubensis]OON76447.1 ribosome maturation factor RimP [Streptomyces tsukubensis]QFR96026.1 ribosome maturation factor RimP [Streptomyces tsukubensis]